MLNKKFFDKQNYTYSTSSQTAISIPLCFGLVDEKYYKQVLGSLLKSIEKSEYALSSGDVGFHFLILALSNAGDSKTIYRMNNRDDVPGYGYQLKKGATALTESWPALEEVSNNHLMLGHLMEWFYSGLAGITQNDNSNAYENILIKSQIVEEIGWVNASYQSIKGKISSSWKKENGKLNLEIEIPVNTKSEIHLPISDEGSITESGININPTCGKIIISYYK